MKYDEQAGRDALLRIQQRMDFKLQEISRFLGKDLAQVAPESLTRSIAEKMKGLPPDEQIEMKIRAARLIASLRALKDEMESHLISVEAEIRQSKSYHQAAKAYGHSGAL